MVRYEYIDNPTVMVNLLGYAYKKLAYFRIALLLFVSSSGLRNRCQNCPQIAMVWIGNPLEFRFVLVFGQFCRECVKGFFEGFMGNKGPATGQMVRDLGCYQAAGDR